MFNSPNRNMRSHFRYLRIGNHGKKNSYLCLEQNPLVLFWLLYWYGKPFVFRGKGVRKTLYGLRRLFYFIRKIVYYQLRSPDTDFILELPVFGHLCLQVHNGYKVFDLRRSVVVKLFSGDVELETVRREINQVRRVGLHDFAPSVRCWNVEERLYEEEYVNGDYPDRSTWTA
ncbi:MAG: hypothetical protein V3U10_02770, partial [Bacteroidota bacterium]